MNKSDSIKELAAALAKAQGEMHNPSFDTQNPFFKSRYASLANVRNTVIPVLSKHGLSVAQFLCGEETRVACETMLLHASGEWMSQTFSVPVGKHDAQGYGSAATYARRYALMALVGVVGDEDDDGNAAVGGADKGRRKQAQPDDRATVVNPPPASPSAGDHGAPSGAESRTDTLHRLCEEAGMVMAQILAKAEVDSAEAMSESDWASAVRMLKKKAASKVAA